MLKGKVIAKLNGKYIPGFAWGTESLIAAGTAIYEALPLKSAKRNASPFESWKKYANVSATEALNILKDLKMLLLKSLSNQFYSLCHYFCLLQIQQQKLNQLQ